jgi:SCL-interrupting locus protein N-terminus
MTNDPVTYTEKVNGVWIYGLDDLRSPYVWTVCSRFVFCKNFKDSSGSKEPLSLSKSQNTFLLVLVSQNHKTLFYSMKVKATDGIDGSLRWTLLNHSQSIDRETNLFFKPFIIRDVFRNMQKSSIEGIIGDESRVRLLAQPVVS